MSNDKLLETIGQVKDEFIEEAAPKGVLENEKKAKKPINIVRFLKWGSLAACLCIIVGLSMRMNLFSATNDSAMLEADQMKPQSAEGFREEPKTPNYSFNESTKGEEDYIKNDTADMNTCTPESGENTSIDTSFPDWGLTLSVKNVTSTGLTLVVTQSGGNPTGDIMTGEPYRLIALVGGTWKAVEELPLPEGVDGRGFNSIGYWIQKGETREFDINWEWIFGELPEGRYRLIKEFMDFRRTADYDTFEYWVEFNVD